MGFAASEDDFSGMPSSCLIEPRQYELLGYHLVPLLGMQGSGVQSISFLTGQSAALV
jgi:hypothetical protein